MHSYSTLLLLTFILSCLFFFFFLMIRRPPRSTLFPTRRSSDLRREFHFEVLVVDAVDATGRVGLAVTRLRAIGGDRKSTRLNSSHSSISYAVFCLKKKKIIRKDVSENKS